VFSEFVLSGSTAAARPTPDQVIQATQRYVTDAQSRSTKPKYLEFHQKNFARLLALAQGKPVERVTFPRGSG
jgi:hypothetical protein